MAFVETTLGSRSFRIDCADAQHERLRRLTGVVEARAAALEDSGAAEAAPDGEDPELRFMLLTALLVADQLLKAEDKIAELEQERLVIEQPSEAMADEMAERAAADKNLIEDAQIEDAQVEETVEEPARRSQQTEKEPDLTLDPQLEAALADLFDSAARRMNEAAAALDRL